MTTAIDSSLVVHWVQIKVFTKRGGDLIERLYWEQLPFAVRVKWDWYFKYRAALLQVKYPKAEVVLLWGHQTGVGVAAHQRVIAAKKAQITKTEKEAAKLCESMQLAAKNWVQLFPIEEHTQYRQARTALAKLNSKLLRLKEELNHLQSKSE